jgi:serine/threonine-protein kinase
MAVFHPPGNGNKPFIKGFIRKVHDILVPDPLVGKEIGGKFRIDEKIARGGMATVYKASMADGKAVALKILDEQFSQEKLAAKFLFEAQLIESIDHPNVVKGLTHGTIDGVRLYLAMEYLEGIDADEIIKQGQRIPPDLALKIILQACRGLEAVHEKGAIHRDVKPANIMVGPDAHAKVIDFGIAKEDSEINSEEWNGLIYGTINYVPPELTCGNEYDKRADIFSLGVASYKMVSGELPIESDDMKELIDLIKSMTPFPPSRRRPEAGITAEVDDLIMRAMSKNPAERYQSAAEMAQAAENALRRL